MKRHRATIVHNYLPKLAILYEQGLIPPRRWKDIEIAHDGWCDYNTGGWCNCDPVVSVGTSTPRAARRTGASLRQIPGREEGSLA